MAQGIVVASIDYRLAPLAPWPAQIQDAACAVRFLRAHAAALGIAPAHIGTWGSSGGGTLATLLGVGHGFGTRPYRGYSSQVEAVADMFGPADWNAMRHAGLSARQWPISRWAIPQQCAGLPAHWRTWQRATRRCSSCREPPIRKRRQPRPGTSIASWLQRAAIRPWFGSAARGTTPTPPARCHRPLRWRGL